MSQGLDTFSTRFDTSGTSGLRHYHNRLLSVDFAGELWTSLSHFDPKDVTSSINQALFINMQSPDCVCPAVVHCKSWPSFCARCKCIWGAAGWEVGDNTRAVVCGEGWGWSHVYSLYCLSARKEERPGPQMSAGLTVPQCCDLSAWAERTVGWAGAIVQVPLLY